MIEKKPLYDKKIKCPVCKIEFTSKSVRVGMLQVEKQDSDFCRHYTVVNPNLYSIFVCPQCGYSATECYYKELDYGQIELIKQSVTSKWMSKSYCLERTLEKAVQCYKLAIYQGHILRRPTSYNAFLWLKIAWLYRIAGNTFEEKKHLLISLTEFEKAFNNDRHLYEDLHLSDVSYLIGEINRRLGNYPTALKWFSITLKHQDIKPRVERLTREQWKQAADTHRVGTLPKAQ